MAAYFLDASALVKRYAREMGTGWMLSLFRPAAGNRLYIARITGVEVAAALTRKQRGAHLTADELSRARAPGYDAILASVSGSLKSRPDY